MRTTKTQIRLGRCSDRSESSLGAQVILLVLSCCSSIWLPRIEVTSRKEMSHCMSKPTKWPAHPGKTQISLSVRPVWSESSLPGWRSIGSLAGIRTHKEDSDQTGWMSRLIRVFVGHKGHFVGFVMLQLKWLNNSQSLQWDLSSGAYLWVGLCKALPQQDVSASSLWWAYWPVRNSDSCLLDNNIPENISIHFSRKPVFLHKYLLMKPVSNAM